MTMTDPEVGDPPATDEDLTGPVGSGTSEGPPAACGAPGLELARVGVPAVPRRTAGSRPAHRRRRQFPWLVVLFGALVVSLAAGTFWAMASSGSPPPVAPVETAPLNVPRLEGPLGRPAEPSRTGVSIAAARVALFDIPALGVETTLADGVDPGTGPVLWPGTPWPGGPGRAVVAIWADLSTLRPGHEVLVGDSAGTGYDVWRVATITQVAVSSWAEVARQGSIVPELALVEAASFGGRTTRTLIVAWPVR